MGITFGETTVKSGYSLVTASINGEFLRSWYLLLRYLGSHCRTHDRLPLGHGDLRMINHLLFSNKSSSAA